MLNSKACTEPCPQLTQAVCVLVILLFNVHLFPLFFRLFTQVHILIEPKILKILWEWITPSLLFLPRQFWYGVLVPVTTYVADPIGFQTFFTGIQNCRRHFKVQYVIAIHLMRWLTNFYEFRFKWTATAAIGIHPTKAWLSQLVNLKNPIWTWRHIRRTICNKILF